MESNISFIGELSHDKINKLNVGDYFTYKVFMQEKEYFKKGLIVCFGTMIPVGLLCSSIQQAEKQN